ncbi:CD209 antigen-like protein D isoform X1 [Chelonoidis abingdonii]|uniref:CD209 antigen-like protein D isoform X1 n=1 Tax=Chelonoidis abingdonii TaxID=106734 RepID=UPI0013F1DFB6|nr:macrophage mannose receptor 1-like isoform X2 [Chelonoidis abingdonii]
MACKATYSNVDIIEPGQEELWGSEPREKAAVSDVYAEEESQYEAVDPAIGARKRQMEQQEARAPEWEWRQSKRWILACTTVLGVSVLLNLLLLTLGVVRYMEMASTLERMQMENQQLQDVGSPASGFFLIYSESHQLCVDVTAGGSLTAAPCTPGAPSQHFQWLSQGQLLSVAHQKCVAVPERLSRMAVRLEPCMDHRELQHWECRANGLLALAKENLYFNYGHSQNHVVMLYTGDGPWSRWVIYGSHEDLCSCACHVCTPCRRGWIFFQDRCYFHSCSLGTWDTANRSCASLGALLLQVTSLAEQAHIVASMKAPSFWIGLTDQAVEGAWMWVDGTHSAANASHWQTGEPNGEQKENCALARQDGHWYDVPCTEQHHWVCEKEP